MDATRRMVLAGPHDEAEWAPARPMIGFLAHLTPEKKAAALAYRGPENIGIEDHRLDTAAGGPVSQVHAGDGGEARRRQAQAMDELLAMSGEELMAEVAPTAPRPSRRTTDEIMRDVSARHPNIERRLAEAEAAEDREAVIVMAALKHELGTKTSAETFRAVLALAKRAVAEAKEV